MKTTKVTAFKANDENLYETESDAINSNITDCIDLINHDCGNSSNALHDDIIDWFRNHPKEVRYVLTNIKHAKAYDE